MYVCVFVCVCVRVFVCVCVWTVSAMTHYNRGWWIGNEQFLEHRSLSSSFINGARLLLEGRPRNYSRCLLYLFPEGGSLIYKVNRIFSKLYFIYALYYGTSELCSRNAMLTTSTTYHCYILQSMIRPSGLQLSGWRILTKATLVFCKTKVTKIWQARNRVPSAAWFRSFGLFRAQVRNNTSHAIAFIYLAPIFCFMNKAHPMSHLNHFAL